jgi:hypothetical protein
MSVREYSRPWLVIATFASVIVALPLLSGLVEIRLSASVIVIGQFIALIAAALVAQELALLRTTLAILGSVGLFAVINPLVLRTFVALKFPLVWPGLIGYAAVIAVSVLAALALGKKSTKPWWFAAAALILGAQIAVLAITPEPFEDLTLSNGLIWNIGLSLSINTLVPYVCVMTAVILSRLLPTGPATVRNERAIQSN